MTDVVMPGMSGAKLVERLRELRPNTRILYMSGYTNEAIGKRGVLEGDVSFLQKPFSAEQLLRKAREVLESSKGPETT
jgi:FixJ family two-component response regulator